MDQGLGFEEGRMNDVDEVGGGATLGHLRGERRVGSGGTGRGEKECAAASR
jgi:hypothetical protein